MKTVVSIVLALFAMTVMPAIAQTKPLESPIHMTMLPVPNEFHENPTNQQLQNSNTGAYSSNTQNAPNSSVLVGYTGMRDDTDAGLAGEGRRR